MPPANEGVFEIADNIVAKDSFIYEIRGVRRTPLLLIFTEVLKLAINHFFKYLHNSIDNPPIIPKKARVPYITHK